MKYMSNRKIFDRANTLNKASITLFSNVIILDYSNVNKLGAEIVLGSDKITQLFSDPNGWLTGLYAYPIDWFNATLDNQPKNSKKLVAGSYQFDNVKCNDFDPDIQFFYLGRFRRQPKYQNFLDGNGFTEYEIYLPFYGTVVIQPNETDIFFNFFISIDCTTGYACYYILASDLNVEPTTGSPLPYVSDADMENFLNIPNLRIVATYDFQLGVSIGLGKSNGQDVKRNAILGAVQMATDALTGGGISERTTNERKTTRTLNSKTGRLRTTKDVTTQSISSSSSMGGVFRSIVNGTISTLRNTVRTASTTSNQPMLKMCGPQSIIVTVKYPEVQPVTYKHEFGLPLEKTKLLSELSGFTLITEIHLEGDGFKYATENEKGLILDALSEGVIL